MHADAAQALEVEGRRLLQALREAFQALPEDAALKQPAHWPAAGFRAENWLAVLDSVLEHGAPHSRGAEGPRFSRELYTVPRELAAGARIQAVTQAPTFFGNYAPPDDLDGQTIDLVATRPASSSSSSSSRRLRVRPAPPRLARDLGTYAEVSQWQARREDRTAIGSIGVVPEDIATAGDGTLVEMKFEVAGLEYTFAKKGQEKVVLSDHMPIGFEFSVEEQSNAEGAWSERHTFSALSMNMLAFEYMPFSFWNTPPSQHLKAVWLLASRVRAAADRKTKWLPSLYGSMCRTNVSEDELASAGDSGTILWERANRRLWAWIARVQTEAFKGQVKGNPLAHDHVRLGIFAKLLVADQSLPDFVFLQEVGLAKLGADAFVDDSGAFAGAAFAEALRQAHPELLPLLEEYQVCNASPKLNTRKGGLPQTTDCGLLLARRTIAQRYDLRPLTCSAHERNGDLADLNVANAGKPLVGVQVRDSEGEPVVDLFGAHFEKGKTRQILDRLLELAADACSGAVPALVVGDFNAVLDGDPATAP